MRKRERRLKRAFDVPAHWVPKIGLKLIVLCTSVAAAALF